MVSDADPKASVGIQQLGEMLQRTGVAFGTTELAADLPETEQENYVQNLMSEGYGINFIQFTKGTVIPKDTQGRASEHMYSFDYA
jgi:hypothetical protein